MPRNLVWFASQWNRIACSVSFQPATPIADCTAIDAIVIEGSIDDAAMTSEGPMGATRQ